MSPLSGHAVDDARRRADLSLAALHLRYIALGGTATRRSLDAHLLDDSPLADAECDVLAQAINEQFMDLDMAERVPQSDGPPE